VKVLVTGATGFVGRWLTRELRAAGHEIAATPDRTILDVADAGGLAAVIRAERPSVVAHLAGMSFGPDAARDPAEALRVNVGGTAALFAALEVAALKAPVLVTGSSEVYGSPDPADLPLTEDSPTRARHPYAVSKLRQEEEAVRCALAHGMPLAVTRSFNHIGPGQRGEFVAPALASRLIEARRSGHNAIRVGNVDVRRDFTDVRDVVRAYRLLLEHLAKARSQEPLIVNVASGRSRSIRELLKMIGEAAGIDPELVVDPALVREDDPPEIIGDASHLRAVTGWEPSIPIDRTVADLVASLGGAPPFPQ
jgi:GDP-4-dehydro-6-deoxy-D-mannose reductase